MGQAVAGYGNFMEPCCRHGGEIDLCYQGDGKVANEAVGLKVGKGDSSCETRTNNCTDESDSCARNLAFRFLH